MLKLKDFLSTETKPVVVPGCEYVALIQFFIIRVILIKKCMHINKVIRLGKISRGEKKPFSPYYEHQINPVSFEIFCLLYKKLDSLY